MANIIDGSSSVRGGGLTAISFRDGVDPEEYLNAKAIRAAEELNAQFLEAVMLGKIMESVRLLDMGANIETRGPDSRTPLIWAASNGNLRMLQFLIKRDVKVNARDTTQGWTPLHYAAYNNHMAIVEELLRNGADPEAKDYKKKRPDQLAKAEVSKVLKKSRKQQAKTLRKMQKSPRVHSGSSDHISTKAMKDSRSKSITHSHTTPPSEESEAYILPSASDPSRMSNARLSLQVRPGVAKSSATAEDPKSRRRSLRKGLSMNKGLSYKSASLKKPAKSEEAHLLESRATAVGGGGSTTPSLMVSHAIDRSGPAIAAKDASSGDEDDKVVLSLERHSQAIRKHEQQLRIYKKRLRVKREAIRRHERELSAREQTMADACAKDLSSAMMMKGTDEDGDGGGASPSSKVDDSALNSVINTVQWEELRVSKLLAEGGFSDVYEAELNGERVAVKRLKIRAKVAETFKKELQLLSKMRHTNIVLLMAACTDYPNLAIVMELMPRGDLFTLVHHSDVEIGWRRARGIALDVGRAMNYLHSMSPMMVHRDLKSRNVLLDENYRAKVTDFGTSRTKEKQFVDTNTTMGTPAWMSPECLRGEEFDEKSDVYSFGVVLWELVTRKVPWGGKPGPQVIGLVGFSESRLPVPSVLPAGFPPNFADLIRECFLSAGDRPSFRSIMKFIQRLSS